MTVSVLDFPCRQMRRPPVASDEAGIEVGIGTIPIWQLWRSLPTNAFGAPEQAELKDLLFTVRPLRVEHRGAALAQDAAAALSLILLMSGVDVFVSVRHDLFVSIVLGPPKPASPRCHLQSDTGVRSAANWPPRRGGSYPAALGLARPRSPPGYRLL